MEIMMQFFSNLKKNRQKHHRFGPQFLLLSLVVFLFSACATHEVKRKAETAQSAGTDAAVVLTDVIVAIGQPDAALSNTLKSNNVVALLGRKNTYMLYVGGDYLTETAKSLNAYKLTIVKDSRKLHLEDKKFWGSIALTYSGTTPSDAEKVSLGKLGFLNKPGRDNEFYKEVYVQGLMYPALPMVQSQQLKQPREISFRGPPATGSGDVNWQLVGEYAAAVTFDIVTSPFQLLGLAVYKIVEKKPPSSK
jgi:hypothetical protein